MNTVTLPVFNEQEFVRAHHFLATQVSEMMGRKLEEGDWAKVYCEAKGIPAAGWSNTDIDIMFGNIGVEQKAMARRSSQPIKESCGTTIMHPAGTRAIRIPAEQDPTKAAQNILQQYATLIARRRLLVSIVDRFNNGELTRIAAVDTLQAEGGYSRSGAENRIPAVPIPGKEGVKEVDLRTGWLLWQDTLREFLYFEEPMTPPDPAQYVAEWRERAGSGSRIGSRNLWIYDKATGEKHFSVTTEAGAKIQPYFRVPNPTDPNLYHFVVQGEVCGNGLIRVWLTQVTANLLREALGDLSPEKIAAAVEAVEFEQHKREASGHSFGPLAVEVLVSARTYERLQVEFHGVSDEHNFKQLIEILKN
jgi:hypothetical protein